jgi:hypothetical protein
MKIRIWLAAGVAGILLSGNFSTTSQAEGRIHYRGWGRAHWGIRGNYWSWSEPCFVIDTRPTFVILPNYGLSVAVGNPFDIIYYDNLYYIYNNSYWYRSSFYNGPWIVIREESLPYKIKGQRLEDILRARDIASGTNELQKQKGHRDDKNSNPTGSGSSNRKQQ